MNKLELTLRIFHFGYPSTALIESNIDGSNYIHENSTFAYRFFPKRLAREFIPLRFEANKPDDVFRIFVLGGSAAQGTPDAAFSFARILDVMLQVRYPDSNFEVLSLAMPAINSHVVLEIAKDCINYNPDLFVVYMGNNEVIGPYGPGTVLTPIISNISLLRLEIKLKATKLYQLLALVLEKLNILNSQNNSWKGMEMFLENQVRLKDPRLEIVYNNFDDNLGELNKISQENDIKIIYSNVASNLKDSPPFNSVHRKDIKLSDQQRWDKIYSSGIAYEKAGDYRKAIEKYLSATSIDSEYANLQFRLGQCYSRIGNFTEASKSYIYAREYDANRFRADKRINEIIQTRATAIKGTTFFANALARFKEKSPNGIAGNEHFLEHVHLNFEGNYLIAETIFEQIEPILSRIFKDKKINEFIQISDSFCADYLAYNTYEQHRILNMVLNGFIKQPPFTNQLFHMETIRYLEDELDSLQQIIQALDSNSTIHTYEYALRKRPSDWMLHYKYAGYLSDDDVHKYRKAVDQYQFVINAVPHDPNTFVMRGAVLAKLGQLGESLNDNRKALKMNPTIAEAYFNSGLIYQKLKKEKLAIENYEKTIYYDPAHSKAYNNLAYIFSHRGNSQKVDTSSI
ncbi:MAG: tetratricopeptide repeat protein [Calditrichaceae bacterium]